MQGFRQLTDVGDDADDFNEPVIKAHAASDDVVVFQKRRASASLDAARARCHAHRRPGQPARSRL